MDDKDIIKLIKINRDSETKIYFASYLREDYVAKSLVITLDGGMTIESIYFSSDTYGTVEWTNGVGLTDCHRWESEDQAKEPSYLTRRYTTILTNGAREADYAKELIIPDILDKLQNADVAEWIRDVIQVREYLVPFDLSLVKQ